MKARIRDSLCRLTWLICIAAVITACLVSSVVAQEEYNEECEVDEEEVQVNIWNDFSTWLKLFGSIGLICLSALFSGLTLGLLGLDKVTLEILEHSGSIEERGYAKKIRPIRERGNLLLCTLLLGNVMVNAGISILTSDLSSGIVGFVVSTILITVFGEIIPQATCARYALFIGSKSVSIVKVFVVLMFPAAFPLSWLLDKVLGDDIGTIYSRAGLKTLIELHAQYQDESGLAATDANILGGALEYSKKKVKEAMTPLDKVFMLDVDVLLDVDVMTNIWQNGYSRIPIYKGSRSNIVGLLFTKDLALVNPEDSVPLRNLLSFYHYELTYVSSEMFLDELLVLFKSGRSHMALVRKGKSNASSSKKPLLTDHDHDSDSDSDSSSDDENDETGSSPADRGVRKSDHYENMGDDGDATTSTTTTETSSIRIKKSASKDGEVIGIITLEDVIEEIINAEILDETDLPLTSDIANDRKYKTTNIRTEINVFARPMKDGSNPSRLTPQQVLAVSSYLVKLKEATPFQLLSDEALGRLLAQSPIVELVKPTSDTEEPQAIYEQNKESAVCCLVLYGKFEVASGADQFKSEYGSWSLLGVRALTTPGPPTTGCFVPDFTARLASPHARILVISRANYMRMLCDSFSHVTDAEELGYMLPAEFAWTKQFICESNGLKMPITATAGHVSSSSSSSSQDQPPAAKSGLVGRIGGISGSASINNLNIVARLSKSPSMPNSFN